MSNKIAAAAFTMGIGMLFAACAADGTDSTKETAAPSVDTEENVGAAQQAVTVGSCQDYCGWLSLDSSGNFVCACTDDCTTYGDCCSDYQTYCSGSNPNLIGTGGLYLTSGSTTCSWWGQSCTSNGYSGTCVYSYFGGLYCQT